MRIYNVNTDKVLVARFPVADGKAVTTGEVAIPGVPGTSPRILLNYCTTIGATTGKLLPSGAALDRITVEDGRCVATSVCDVANCCAFVPAVDLGLTGSEQRAVLEEEALAPLLSEVRGKAAVLAGRRSDHHSQGELGSDGGEPRSGAATWTEVLRASSSSSRRPR